MVGIKYGARQTSHYNNYSNNIFWRAFTVLWFVCCRLRGRETLDREEEEAQAKKEEGQEAQAVQGKGLQKAEEVHAAAAVGVQAQVLHSRAVDVGRASADRGHDRFRRFLLCAVRRRPGSQGTPLMEKQACTYTLYCIPYKNTITICACSHMTYRIDLYCFLRNEKPTTYFITIRARQWYTGLARF